jgi:HD superfamily phosphohydrolase
MILNYISKTYNIDIDLERIRMMIIPPKKSTDNIENKKFLFRIVSNPESGIDVDKFDYIARDTYNIGLKFGFDCSRLVNECRIIDGELCFPNKEIYNIYEMYHTRYRLHKQVYHHHAVHSIEHMYADLLKELDYTLEISKMIDDPKEFCKLTDNYIINIIRNDIEDNITDNTIGNTQNPIVSTRFLKAKMILDRIDRRELYKFVGEFIISPDKDLNLLDKFEADLREKNTNIFISRSIIGFNKEGFNPVDQIYFYKIGDKNRKFKIDRTKVSCLLPERYNELIIRFFCKSKEYLSVTKHYFELFKKVLTKS